MKMNMKVHVKSLLNIMMRLKMNLFYKHEHENETNFFCNKKLKFTLEPRS